MSPIDLIIIIVVVFFVYRLTRSKRSVEHLEDNTTESERRDKRRHRHRKKSSNRHKMERYLDVDMKRVSHESPELIFTESQFHNDYRDLITAVSTMADQKQLFNTGGLPVKNTKPNDRKSKRLINYFMNELNRVVMEKASGSLGTNGTWNDVLPMENVKSGWDKQMEKLGLPTSVYTAPAKSAKVKMLEMKSCYATETDDDMRITCVLLCKKENTTDQILFKVNFWADKKDINGDRDFFKDNDDTYSIDDEEELRIVIEQIFILGYYVQEYSGSSTMRKDFYKFDNLEGQDGMMDQKEILRQLMKKQRDRARETNTVINPDNPNSLQLKKQTPHLTNYEEFENTRTIFD